MKATLVGFALLLLTAPAFAQTPADSRWSQWLGCWELVTEDLRQSGRGGLPLTSLQDGKPRICVTPSADGGARFETTVADKPAVEYTIVANGAERPLTDTECRGTQRAEWSEDGLRVFARAELTCAGDKGPRRVSGIALIAPNGEWVDLQAVQLEGRENVRVRRYRRPRTDFLADRIAPGSPLSLDDVKEAVRKASPLALEAALVETNAGYDLNSRRLLDLEQAGVPAQVIDLIVALSYPEKFVVERRVRTVSTTTYINDPFSYGWAYYNPLWYNDFYYSPYYYSPYYGSRFGGNVYYAGDLVPVVIGGGSAAPQPSGAGRVVDGLGYTRVRTREPEPSAGPRTRTSSVGSAAGSTASSSGSSSSSSSGSSSSGGATSGGGYSSGSGSTDTGRTAQPR